LELGSGNFQKDIDSIILTHVQDEGGPFAAEVSNSEFRRMVNETYGKSENISLPILERYPNVEADGSTRFRNGKERMAEWMSQSVFNCQARAIADAYSNKLYLGQYSRGNGRHGE
jgi:hypothetical protein